MIRQAFAPFPYDAAERCHVAGVDLKFPQRMLHVVVALPAKPERHGAGDRFVLERRSCPVLFFPLHSVFVVIGGGIDEGDVADAERGVQGCVCQ